MLTKSLVLLLSSLFVVTLAHPIACHTRTSFCKVGGCSGELCYNPATQSGISICIFKPEYACFKTANCETQGTGCGWRQTPELLECIRSKRGETQ